MWTMLEWAPEQTLRACSAAAAGKDAVAAVVALQQIPPCSFPCQVLLVREGETPALVPPSSPLPCKRCCPSPSPLERCIISLTFRGMLRVAYPWGQGETLEHDASKEEGCRDPRIGDVVR